MTDFLPIPLVFAWERPSGGFRWVDTTGGRASGSNQPSKQRYLVPVGEYEKVDWRRVYPLRTPYLYREFSELVITEESILEFANCYGLLDDGNEIQVDGSATLGMSLEHWGASIEGLRALLSIWDACLGADRQKLERLVSLTGSAFTYIGPKFCFIDREDLRFDFGKRPRNLFEAAKRFVAFRLHDNIDRTRSSLALVGDENRLQFIFEPVSLWAAIWLQFFQLTQQATPNQRRCSQCGKWFAIAVGENRPDRRFDTEACKARGYRRRKREAVLMREQGLQLSEIAQHLESEVPTVRGWVQKRKAAT